jgi:hypothetical protein
MKTTKGFLWAGCAALALSFASCDNTKKEKEGSDDATKTEVKDETPPVNDEVVPTGDSLKTDAPEEGAEAVKEEAVEAK